MSVNQAVLVGRLTDNPKLSYTPQPNQTAVLNFTVATSESWKDKQGNWNDSTEFTDCVLWGKNAESLADRCQKGSYVTVEGSLQTRKWEDKQGNKRYKTEVKVSKCRLLTDKKQSDTRDYSNEASELPDSPVNQDKITKHFTTDDLPF